MTVRQIEFRNWLDEHNKPGSHKAGSYLRVAQCIMHALQKVPRFSGLPDDFCEIDDRAVLRDIYETVLDEQRKANGGIFDGTELTRGYWGKNFCSATVRDYINFKIAAPYEASVRAVFTAFSDGAEAAARIDGLNNLRAEDWILDRAEEGRFVGKEKVRVVTERVNQSLFRAAILQSYHGACCITGLSVPQVLDAGHISGWKVDKANRMNLSNGLCFSATYHRAFDANLISFDDDYRLVLSESIKEYFTQQIARDYFEVHEGKRLALPIKFLPDKTLLARHRENLVA